MSEGNNNFSSESSSIDNSQLSSSVGKESIEEHREFNYADLINYVLKLQKQIDRVSSDFGTLEDNQQIVYKNQKELTEKIEKEAKRGQVKIIESIGIFVAIFTFISVSSDTFLKFESIYNALFFLSIFTIILTSFIIVFHFILNIDSDEGLQIKKLLKVLSCLIIPFSLVAIVIYCVGAISVDEKDKSEEKDKQIVHQTTDVNIGMDTIISTNTITVSTNVYTSLKK